MTATLADWLASRSAGQLADLLSRRPEVLVAPAPRDLVELADRLAASVAPVLYTLPLPALQLIELLQLLGPDRGDRATIAAWLGRDPREASVEQTVAHLTDLALVWPDGGALRMADPLYDTFRFPLGLGAPALEMLARCSAEQLRGFARRLGLPTHGRKSDLVARVHGLLSEHEQVRAVVAEADPLIRDRLRALAVDGPQPDHLAGWYHHDLDPALRWGAERGLVLPDPWGILQLPMEVGVALRGPDWHAPFTPERPEPRQIDVPADEVARDCAAAGAATVEAIRLLLAAVDLTRVSMLKSGGVGTRELRRLSRAIGSDEAATRLWLELAHAAGLITVVADRTGGAELLPTSAYDQWLGQQPAEQLAAVLRAWSHLEAAPLQSAADGQSKPPPPLSRGHGFTPAALRRTILWLLYSLPSDRGIADPAELPRLLEWAAPLEVTAAPEPAGLADALWREAELLGVVLRGALTPLGRALLHHPAAAEDPTDPLVEAGRKLLPGATEQATFQADLTALVPGFPARALADLLDAGADRESSGGAVTWRFSPGSVRRAFDTGWQAEPLLAALTEHATGGRLPQPLTYLINDVARRHGKLRVRAVGCLLRADDPALIAELAGARALRALRLQAVAPTVLASPSPLEQVLAGLREAGYAPVAEDSDGVPQLARMPRRRAQPRQSPQRFTRHAGSADRPAAQPVNPAQLATQLLEAPMPPRPPAPRQPADAAPLRPGTAGAPDPAAALAQQAYHLNDRERAQLLAAIQTGEPVTIDYVDLAGEHTVRVIDSIELDGAHLIAWCHLRQDERRFALRRVVAVSPP